MKQVEHFCCLNSPGRFSRIAAGPSISLEKKQEEMGRNGVGKKHSKVRSAYWDLNNLVKRKIRVPAVGHDLYEETDFVAAISIF